MLLNKLDSSILKGIAILLVIICHIGNNYFRYFTPLGGIGVSIFLILSGYGLTASYNRNGLKEFWKKRISTVIIPYFILEIYSYFFVNDFNFKTFLLDILLIKLLYPIGWYLNYLVIWYMLFWLIMFPKISFDKKLLGLLLVSITMYYHYIGSDGIRVEQSFSFFLGCVLCRYDREIWNYYKNINFKYIKLMLSSLFIFGLAALIVKQNYNIRNNIIYMHLIDTIIKMVFSVGITLFVIRYKDIISQRVKNTLLYFGYNSYELYLSHGYFLSIFSYDFSNIIKITIFISISMFFSYIIKRTYKAIMIFLKEIK